MNILKISFLRAGVKTPMFTGLSTQSLAHKGETVANTSFRALLEVSFRALMSVRVSILPSVLAIEFSSLWLLYRLTRPLHSSFKTLCSTLRHAFFFSTSLRMLRISFDSAALSDSNISFLLLCHVAVDQLGETEHRMHNVVLIIMTGPPLLLSPRTIIIIIPRSPGHFVS